MRKFLSLIVLSGLFFMSCSNDGEVGPRGPQGPPGEDGLDGLGYTYERTIDFDYFSDVNLYSQLISNIEILETDAVLVYWLEAVDDGSDVWSLLPQTFYFDDGQFQYNYNHTDFDVNIYLQGNIDLATLGDGYTQDQIFKIVVLPVDYATSASVDLSNYQELKKSITLKELEVKAKVQ